MLHLQLMRGHDKEMEALHVKHKEDVERMEKEHNQVRFCCLALHLVCFCSKSLNEPLTRNS